MSLLRGALESQVNLSEDTTTAGLRSETPFDASWITSGMRHK